MKGQKSEKATRVGFGSSAPRWRPASNGVPSPGRYRTTPSIPTVEQIRKNRIQANRTRILQRTPRRSRRTALNPNPSPVLEAPAGELAEVQAWEAEVHVPLLTLPSVTPSPSPSTSTPSVIPPHEEQETGAPSSRKSLVFKSNESLEQKQDQDSIEDQMGVSSREESVREHDEADMNTSDVEAEEDLVEAEDMETLPDPVWSFRAVPDADWELYSKNMRNGVRSSNKIRLSPRTPLPQPVSRIHPDGDLTWTQNTDGGASSTFPLPSNYYDYGFSTGFLRFQSGEETLRREAKAEVELVLLVLRGTVLIEYYTNRRTRRGRGRCLYYRFLPPQSVLSIQPGVRYALKNTTAEDLIIYYIEKNLGNGRRRSREEHPRSTEPNQLRWAFPSDFGSVGEVGMERCWTWVTQDEGFVKIPPFTCSGFAINKFGPVIYFVFSGEIKVRSSQYVQDQNSSNENEDEEGGNGSIQEVDDPINGVPRRCLVPEVYGEGTSFLIPVDCCFSLENWNEGRNVILFYHTMEIDNELRSATSA